MEKTELGLLLLLFLQTGGTLDLNMPSSYIVRMGSDNWIPCTYTAKKLPADPKYFAVFWYYKGSEILSYNDVVKTQDPRYSLNTISPLNGDASLSISRVMVSDEGVYTCSILYSPEIKEKELVLFVHAPPVINVTRRITFIDRQSILRADITGFYPVDTDVKWFRDGEILNNYTVSTSQRNRDGTYSVTSTMTITPTKEDKHRTFSCRVQHESLSGPLREDFQLEFADLLKISITGKYIVMFYEHDLSCLVTGFYLEDIDVKLFKDGKMMDGVSVSKPQKNPDGTFTVISTVTIKPFEERHRTFSCRVQHESLVEPLHEDFQLDFTGYSILICLLAMCISIVMICRVGSVIDCYKNCRTKKLRLKVTNLKRCTFLNYNNLVILQCEISNFYPAKVTVTWSTHKQGSQDIVHVDPNNKYWIPKLRYKKQRDTYSCTAFLFFVPSQELDHRTEFLCRVEHPSLKRSIVKIFKPLQQPKKKPGDGPARPFGPGIQDSNEELVPLDGAGLEVDGIRIRTYLRYYDLAILQCKISKFYPDNVTVTWSKHEKGSQDIVRVVSNKRYWIPALVPQKQQDHTYSCTAFLVFTPSSKSDYDAEFICRVEHPSLEEPIERRTEPLRVMGFCIRVKDIKIPIKLPNNQEAVLQCEISRILTQDLTVTWYKREQGRLEEVQLFTNEKYQILELLYVKQRDHTYRCMAHLVFIPSYESDDGAEFMCRVEHPKLERPIQRRTFPLHVNKQLVEEDIEQGGRTSAGQWSKRNTESQTNVSLEHKQVTTAETDTETVTLIVHNSDGGNVEGAVKYTTTNK